MKKIALLTLSLMVASCASKMPTPTSMPLRKIASLTDLTGTYLGEAHYPKGHEGSNKPAVRIYFSPVEGKEDTYNVVLLEYVNLLKMAPSYVVSNKMPQVLEKTGRDYLKDINSKISAYEATPGKVPNTYELRPLTVMKDEIVPNTSVDPRILTLGDVTGPNPIEGATISKVRADEPELIVFPKEGDSTGLQYKTAKTAYKVAKLESTWRKQFLKGPYLSQYYKKSDVVVKMTTPKEGENLATFVPGVVGKKSKKERADMFTNKKSGELEGTFSLSEPRDGMFVFHNVDATTKTLEVIEGRICMFIDIFDATKSLHQDVVEVVMVNTEDPSDFLMYYEDPNNGEGRSMELQK